MTNEQDGSQIRPTSGNEHSLLPPRVNFLTIAQNAIAGGLFDVDANHTRVNKGIRGEYSRLPTSLLDSPYPNGPMVIQRFEKDVPEASVNAVRRNFIKANRLLLPTEQVMLYFHQRFTDGSVFQSGVLAKLVDDYRAPGGFGKNFKDDSISFRTDVERKANDRNLYTREEEFEALRLVQSHPELVLAVLTYQAVLQDYFGELRGIFAGMVGQPNSRITPRDMELYDKYVKQWATNNFTDELIPALAIFYRQNKDSNPEASDEQTMSQDLFQNAVDFIISNGAFRNWVRVPAEIAQDGKERVNHFLCPAVGTVREQLLDGSLLNRIHGIIRQKVATGDSRFVVLAGTIQERAQEKFKQKDKKPLSKEDLDRWYEERKKVAFNYGGVDYTVKVEKSISDLLKAKQQRGDLILDPMVGSLFYHVIVEAARMAVTQSQPVFFSFNGIGYRLTPDKIKEVLIVSGQITS